MGKPTGFFEFARRVAPRRPVDERLRDWKEVYLPIADETLRRQGARCMDCGVPFCHQGCPLGNLIPDWNDLVYRDNWTEGIVRLHATNNFPEFTGRLCPAPCEGSCVLAINDDPVSIKQIENALIDRAFEEGWVQPQPPAERTGKKVAVVGSGPAGLAAAQQLNRAGHLVTVFERDDRLGGLLRYGIPEFKMEKSLLERRLQQMEQEGVLFQTGCDVGVTISTHKLREDFDGMVLAGGARQPRDLPIPGRELEGIHFAMPYLTLQNRLCEGDEVSQDPFLNAAGKPVVIIGGGDTGADCLGNRPPAGGHVGHATRAAAASARSARHRNESLASLSADLSRVVGTRGRWGAPVLDLNQAIRRRWWRGQKAPNRSSRDEDRSERASHVRGAAGHRKRDRRRAGVARHGFRRSGTEWASRGARRSSSPSAATFSVTRHGPRAFRASSPPATCSTASHLSSGQSPKAAPAHARWTLT